MTIEAQTLVSVPKEHVVAGSARLSAVSWHSDAEMGFAEWIGCGRRLGAIGRNIAWWIGDWLVYGNARYGERYPRAAKITGYDVQSLMNMAWVASRFDASRRREGLSWSHHAEVAALTSADQEIWLDRAETERLSVHCLRTELRAAQRGELPPPVHAEQRTSICPHCGGDVAASA